MQQKILQSWFVLPILPTVCTTSIVLFMITTQKTQTGDLCVLSLVEIQQMYRCVVVIVVQHKKYVLVSLLGVANKKMIFFLSECTCLWMMSICVCVFVGCMYVSMYIFMYVCIYVCMLIVRNVCIYVCMLIVRSSPARGSPNSGFGPWSGFLYPVLGTFVPDDPKTSFEDALHTQTPAFWRPPLQKGFPTINMCVYLCMFVFMHVYILIYRILSTLYIYIYATGARQV